jgi:hypothetical protein
MSDHDRYNQLPSPETANENAEKFPEALPALLNVIGKHQLQSVFGVRLLHRHFRLNDKGEIAVFQNMTNVVGEDVLVLSPQQYDDPLSRPAARNFHFHEGRLVPYEYTTEQPRAENEDLAQYQSFVDDYVRALEEQGVKHVYGLTVLPTEDWTETQEVVAPDDAQRFTAAIHKEIVNAPNEVGVSDATWKAGQDINPVAVGPGCVHLDGIHCSSCWLPPPGEVPEKIHAMLSEISHRLG